MENIKAFLIILIIMIVGTGLYLFFMERDEKTEEERGEKVFDFYIVGDLIINTPGIEEDVWHIVDVVESPGVTRRITIDEDIYCMGEEEKCAHFFDLDESLSGERVKVGGEEKNSQIRIYEIDFSFED